MEYGPSDSSGTDDDLPPSHHNRAARGGRVSGNGRTAGAVAYPRVQNDMESQIHRLEKEAYGSILCAFKAQSDAITWEKEDLITELRRELRMSDEDHRELLSRVNADDTIRRIREWRQAGGFQSSLQNNSQPVHDAIPSPTVSASRKRPKTSQSMASIPLGAPSSALHLQPLGAASMQPSPSVAKKGGTPLVKGKKPRQGQMLPDASTTKPIQYPSVPSGRGRVVNRSSSGAVEFLEGALPSHETSLIGRKVRTRWPEDNNFYDAVITDYNQAEGLHALVYDMNTSNETWEWVDLKEISPDDIQWVGEDPGISRAGQSGPGRGNKKPPGRIGPAPSVGRGRGALKAQPKKGFPPTQNGIGRNSSNDIELLNTGTVIKEVERVLFNASHPDPLEMEMARKMLRDHEQSLVDAIARLADMSDGESDEGEHEFPRGQSMYRDRAWRNQHGSAV